jgi:hypothetical protein
MSLKSALIVLFASFAIFDLIAYLILLNMHDVPNFSNLIWLGGAIWPVAFIDVFFFLWYLQRKKMWK